MANVLKMVDQAAIIELWQRGWSQRRIAQVTGVHRETVGRSALDLVLLTRSNIGVTWGNPIVTPGGKALKYFASIRLEINVVSRIKKDKDTIGVTSRVKVVKNKTNTPFGQCEFDITHGRGINNVNELILIGSERNIVQKKGSWFTYGEVTKQGMDNMAEYIKEEPDVYDKLKQEVYNEIFS